MKKREPVFSEPEKDAVKDVRGGEDAAGGAREDA